MHYIPAILNIQGKQKFLKQNRSSKLVVNEGILVVSDNVTLMSKGANRALCDVYKVGTTIVAQYTACLA